VDDVPDRRDDETARTDDPVAPAEPSGPSTDRVRIVGAEPAGEATAVVPVVTPLADGEADPAAELSADDAAGPPSVRLTDQPADPGGPAVHPVVPGQTAVPGQSGMDPSGPPPTELPHWTEPPTGQVPAVLSRDRDDDPSPSIGSPTWREEDADWVAHDEEFEPAMFGDDAVALGSLDESDSTDADRRPWEFDLDASPHTVPPVRPPDGEGEADAHITEPVPVVSARAEDDPDLAALTDGPEESLFGSPAARPADGSAAASVAAAAGATAGSGPGETAAVGPTDDRPEPTGGHEEEFYPAEAGLPTGSARVGRARRNGLLPARMRAKRPDDADLPGDPPLAAEPPGASVTEVPGVGRKRGGVVGLAAADRTADRDAGSLTTEAGETTRSLPSDGVDMAATAAVAAGVAPRRQRRRPSGTDDTATGGGPPAPRVPRQPAGGERAGGHPRQGGSSLGLRIGTGVAVAVIALLAFKLGTVTSLILCLIVVTFAAGECFGVLRRAGYHTATLLGLVGTISLMVGAYNKGVAALPLIMVLIAAFTLLWYLLGIERGSPVAGSAATMLTVGWVSLMGAYAGLLLCPSTFPDRHGIAFLLGAIIATVANDVGALVVGGWMGRHPLAPSISPNKTWEGLLGGTILTVVVSTVAVGAIHPWTPGKAALLGLVVAVVAPIGDLCESLLKRDLRLKDMGTLLPGHGGVLDRVDALLFVLPATYYLVRALNIG
jgi:CDP-diglyceride synthetase